MLRFHDWRVNCHQSVTTYHRTVLTCSIFIIDGHWEHVTGDYCSCCASGLLGALPVCRSHHAVPEGERQGASVDTGQRRARDLYAEAGPRVLAPAPRLLPRCHGDCAPLPCTGWRIHWPQEPQICHEAAVWDVCLESGTEKRKKARWSRWREPLLFNYFFLYRWARVVCLIYYYFLNIYVDGLDWTVLAHFKRRRLAFPSRRPHKVSVTVQSWGPLEGVVIVEMSLYPQWNCRLILWNAKLTTQKACVKS